MSMHTVEVNLKTQQARALRAAHRKADTGSALRAAIDEAIMRAQLKAHYPQPHVANTATVRVLKSQAGGRSFKSRADFAQWLKTIPSR